MDTVQDDPAVTFCLRANQLFRTNKDSIPSGEKGGTFISLIYPPTAPSGRPHMNPFLTYASLVSRICLGLFAVIAIVGNADSAQSESPIRAGQ